MSNIIINNKKSLIFIVYFRIIWTKNSLINSTVKVTNLENMQVNKVSLFCANFRTNF